VRDAMNRVQPDIRDYVMKRAEDCLQQKRGESRCPASKDHQQVLNGWRSVPSFSTAIAAAEAVMLRGSLMSAAQRRDHVLDQSASGVTGKRR
jgi:hypothetical protein